MCSTTCMSSESLRCRCECGGATHGIWAEPEKRLKFVQKKCAGAVYFIGKVPQTKGLCLHYKDDRITFYLKDDKVYLGALKIGRGWPLTFFDIIHGIPF